MVRPRKKGWGGSVVRPNHHGDCYFAAGAAAATTDPVAGAVGLVPPIDLMIASIWAAAALMSFTVWMSSWRLTPVAVDCAVASVPTCVSAAAVDPSTLNARSATLVPTGPTRAPTRASTSGATT